MLIIKNNSLDLTLPTRQHRQPSRSNNATSLRRESQPPTSERRWRARTQARCVAYFGRVLSRFYLVSMVMMLVECNVYMCNDVVLSVWFSHTYHDQIIKSGRTFCSRDS